MKDEHVKNAITKGIETLSRVAMERSKFRTIYNHRCVVCNDCDPEMVGWGSLTLCIHCCASIEDNPQEKLDQIYKEYCAAARVRATNEI